MYIHAEIEFKMTSMLRHSVFQSDDPEFNNKADETKTIYHKSVKFRCRFCLFSHCAMNLFIG